MPKDLFCECGGKLLTDPEGGLLQDWCDWCNTSIFDGSAAAIRRRLEVKGLDSYLTEADFWDGDNSASE